MVELTPAQQSLLLAACAPGGTQCSGRSKKGLTILLNLGLVTVETGSVQFPMLYRVHATEVGRRFLDQTISKGK